MRPDPSGSRFEVAVPGGVIVAQRAGVGDPALLLHGGPGLSEHLDELADAHASRRSASSSAASRRRRSRARSTSRATSPTRSRCWTSPASSGRG
jgi:hypothetical protein